MDSLSVKAMVNLEVIASQFLLQIRAVVLLGSGPPNRSYTNCRVCAGDLKPTKSVLKKEKEVLLASVGVSSLNWFIPLRLDNL